MQFTRTSLTLIATIAFSLVVATSCKKSNSGSSAAVTATVGGTAFTPATSAAAYATVSKYFDIAGYTAKGTDTTLLDVSFSAPVTVNKVLGPADGVFVQYTSSGKSYISGQAWGAALTVTSLDTVNHKIAGNFTATVYNLSNGSDSLMLTNGKFSSSYILLNY